MSPGVPARRGRAVGEEQKAARRRQILLAAKKVFADRGFQSTTMSDVASVAGMSYGAVYWYFSSKEELFHALMDLEDVALRARIAQAVGDQADQEPRESLRRAISATFKFFEEDKAAVKLLFRDSYALGGRFEMHLFGIYERFIDDLAALFGAAQRRGEIIVVPPPGGGVQRRRPHRPAGLPPPHHRRQI